MKCQLVNVFYMPVTSSSCVDAQVHDIHNDDRGTEGETLPDCITMKWRLIVTRLDAHQNGAIQY